MRKILFVAAILTLGFTSANAQYGPRNDRYDNRDNRPEYDNRDNRPAYGDGRGSEISFMQRDVRQQISAGVRSRRLTPREANALMREYERIEHLERKFSHRGRLSNRENRILKEDLRRLMANTQRLSSSRGDNWARGGRY